MNKKIFFNFKIKESMIRSESLEAMLYGSMPGNLNAYMAMDKNSQFMTSMREGDIKHRKLQLIAISKEKIEKFIEVLMDRLPELAQLCEDSETSLEEMVGESKDIFLNVVFKQIQLFQKALQTGLKMPKQISTSDWIIKSTEEREDLIALLGLLFFQNHMTPYKFSAAKQEKYAQIIETHRYRCLLQYQVESKDELAFQKNTDTVRMEREIITKTRVIEEKKKELAKLHETIAENNKKLKSLSKNRDSAELAAVKSQLVQSNLDSKKLEMELGELKTSTVKKELYNQTTSELKEIKSQHREIISENTQLKVMIESHSIRTIEQQLAEYLKKNGMSEELMQVIHPYYTDFMEGRKTTGFFSEDHAENIIGVCMIKNMGHFIKDAQGNENRVFNIPETYYVGQGQFILVDKEFNFIWAYDYQYSPPGLDNDVQQYGVIRSEGGITCAVLQNGQCIPLENPKSYTLQPDRLVGINGKCEAVKIYKSIRFNADLYLDSALVRNQRVYLILRIIEEGLLVTNIATDKESFIKPQCTLNLEPLTIIFVKDETVIKALRSALFYTGSAKYQHFEYGSVISVNGRNLFERVNGERLAIGRVPETIDLMEGDVICVDEFVQFISRRELDDSPLFQRTPTKLPVRQQQIQENDESDADALEEEPSFRDERVLIIGDKGFAQTYILTLLRHGFRSEVVDGFEPWQKICKASRNADVIVFVTEHASHTNYHKFKSECADKQIIYSSTEGVNRILEQLKTSLGSGSRAEWDFQDEEQEA